MHSLKLHLGFFALLFSSALFAENTVVFDNQSYSSPHVGQAISAMQNGADYFKLQSMLSMMQDNQDDDHGHGGGKGGKGGKGGGHGKGGKGGKGKGGCDKGKSQADQAAVLEFMTKQLKNADCVARGGAVLPDGNCSLVAIQLPPPGTIFRAIPVPAPYTQVPRPLPGYGAQPMPVGFPPGIANQIVNLNQPIY